MKNCSVKCEYNMHWSILSRQKFGSLQGKIKAKVNYYLIRPTVSNFKPETVKQ